MEKENKVGKGRRERGQEGGQEGGREEAKEGAGREEGAPRHPVCACSRSFVVGRARLCRAHLRPSTSVRTRRRPFALVRVRSRSSAPVHARLRSCRTRSRPWGCALVRSSCRGVVRVCSCAFVPSRIVRS